MPARIEALHCPACGAPLTLQPRPYVQFSCPACGSALMLTDFDQQGAIVCERCETANDPGERFCRRCHAPLQAGCPYCYTINRVDALRCANCGIDLQRAWSRQRSWLAKKQSHDTDRREITRQAIIESRKAEIERLLLQLDEPENHPLAVFCLQQYGAEAIDGLIGALTSPDTDARYGAAHTLGLIGDRRAIPALIEALKDAEPAVRYWAVESLGKLEAHGAVPALEKIKNDRVKPVREKVRAVLVLLSG